jgi:hypothetical protein
MTVASASLTALKEATLAWLAQDAPKAPHGLPVAVHLQKAWQALGEAAYPELLALVATPPGITINVLDRLVINAWHAKTDRATWQALVNWAIEVGFSPNRFNGMATPVGTAGYTGQVDLLEVFRLAGADLNLVLSAEHAQGSGLAGTTLLYRVALRPFPDVSGALKVVHYLLKHVPGAYRPDEMGRTPLSDPWMPAIMREAIAQFLADLGTPDTSEAVPATPAKE